MVFLPGSLVDFICSFFAAAEFLCFHENQSDDQSKPPLSFPLLCAFSGSEVSLSHSNMSESGKANHGSLQAKGDKSHGGEFGYVGIDAILEQMRRKAMKQGFELNLMVVGTSALSPQHNHHLALHISRL